MTDLERLQAWLETYPRAGELTSYQVDYTDQLPGCFGVFPAGMVEVERTENLLGQVTVQNQYNFALYVVFAKAPGDTEGAQISGYRNRVFCARHQLSATSTSIVNVCAPRMARCMMQN